MKERKKWAMIRITEEARERLEKYKMQTKDSYSTIILKNIAPPTWKDKLFEHFKRMEEDFPDKTGILEYMRVIILNSKELPASAGYDKEVELRLNELARYGLELRHNSREIKNATKSSFHQSYNGDLYDCKNNQFGGFPVNTKETMRRNEDVEGSIHQSYNGDLYAFLKNHPNKFFTAKEIANSLNIEGKESISKVCTVLYRLWGNNDIERRKRGKLWEYRYKITEKHSNQAGREVM